MDINGGNGMKKENERLIINVTFVIYFLTYLIIRFMSEPPNIFIGCDTPAPDASTMCRWGLGNVSVLFDLFSTLLCLELGFDVTNALNCSLFQNAVLIIIKRVYYTVIVPTSTIFPQSSRNETSLLPDKSFVR